MSNPKPLDLSLIEEEIRAQRAALDLVDAASRSRDILQLCSALLAECRRLRTSEANLHLALSQCASWLGNNRPLETNKRSDAARACLQSAREALYAVGEASEAGEVA